MKNNLLNKQDNNRLKNKKQSIEMSDDESTYRNYGITRNCCD